MRPKKIAKPPLQLVTPLFPRVRCAETVKLLEELLMAAMRGDLIGVALVAQYRDKEYIADVSGECKRAPTLARGMLCKLDDELGKLVGGVK